MIYIYIMSKVLHIGISSVSGTKIKSLNTVKAVKGKGLLNDRHYKDDNNNIKQITLIEIEKINNYNKKFNKNISPLSFRRNIVTQNIDLNNLVGKKFNIGTVNLKAHDLCRPCKYLQNSLNQENIIKEFLHSGGIRCEILSDGIINVGDEVKF